MRIVEGEMTQIGIRSTVAIPAVVFLLFTSNLFGSQHEEPFELESVMVVTASRGPEQFGAASGSVSVITSEDIRLSVAEDLPELLRLQAGIDIIRTGGPGAQTSIFLRGSNSNHVLVLIDGIRVASAHTGAYAWEQLPLNQVERIEIVRGPRASLYGSDAIGGVIQVFTRKTPRHHLRITGGSYGTAEIETGLGFENQRGRFSLNAAKRHSRGFSSQNSSGFSYNPDNDGLESGNIGINGALEADSGRMNYLLLASDNETEFDEGLSEARQLVAAVAWHGSFRSGWDYQLQAGLTDDDLTSDFIFFSSDFQSRRLELSWQNFVLLDGASIGFGLDYHDDSGVSPGSYDESRDNTGLYVLWDRPMSRADLQLSARLDDNSEFGAEFTWQAALGIAIGKAGKLTGLAGSAFRAPSLNEQFSPGFGGLFGGNPLLGPESSETLELVYRHDYGEHGSLSVSAYRTGVDGLIAFSGEDFGAININEAEIQGLELEYGVNNEQWAINASITLQDTRDHETGASLLRRPDEKASFAVDRKFASGAWAGADWFISGQRLDFGGQALPGYGILSFRGGLALPRNLVLEARLENLLDRDYEPAAGFNSPGRSVFVSLGWRP
jgi:vitamin B12 transporter